MSDSLRPNGLQHARLPCPSPSPGIAQTHVHRVGDAIPPTHPLSSPSPPPFNLSQHQGELFLISAQFCCEPKTTLNNKIYYLKMQ